MNKVTFGIGLAMLVGCAASRVDLSAAGRVRVGQGGSRMVDVAPPQVVAEGGNLVVSGTVARRPGFNGPVLGTLEVTVLAADGTTVLQSFSTGWDPPHIPVDGDRRATYRVQYGWVPPDGSTVRVDHDPDPDGNPTAAAALYRPRYRATDSRVQLLDGLGGSRDWSYRQPQRVQDARQR